MSASAAPPHAPRLAGGRLAALVTLGLGLAGCSHAPQRPPCPPSPRRGNALEGGAWSATEGASYDLVPLPPVPGNDERGLLVVHSRRDADDGSAPCGPAPGGSPANTAGIWIVPLEPPEEAPERGQVLVFGAGYGDWCLASLGAACDARSVALALRAELGLVPERTDVRFVAPHGHVDHVNPEFLAGLAALGFRIVEIAYDAADAAVDYPGPPLVAMHWSPSQRARLVAWSDPREANGGSGAYASPLGLVSFRSRPGHTPGSLDLVLDTPEGTVVVRGSAFDPAGRRASPEPLLDLPAHGDPAPFVRAALALQSSGSAR